MDRAVATHLSYLMGRLLYLEQLDEQHGPNRGRMNEHTAIDWAIRALAEQYPAEVAEGEIIAEDRDRRRAEKHGG